MHRVTPLVVIVLASLLTACTVTRTDRGSGYEDHTDDRQTRERTPEGNIKTTDGKTQSVERPDRRDRSRRGPSDRAEKVRKGKQGRRKRAKKGKKHRHEDRSRRHRRGEKSRKGTKHRKRKRDRGHRDKSRAMSDRDFRDLLESIDDESFSRDKMRIVRMAAKDNYFTSDQVKRIVESVRSKNNRVETCVELYPRVVDQRNFHNVISALTFSSEKREVEERLDL